jgi:hypothetical protein
MGTGSVQRPAAALIDPTVAGEDYLVRVAHCGALVYSGLHETLLVAVLVCERIALSWLCPQRAGYIFRTAMDCIISSTYRQVYRTTQETMPGARPIDRRA